MWSFIASFTAEQLSAVAAALSAAVAAWQLRETRRDSNRRQAIELVRDMGARLEALHELDLASLHDELALAYSEGRPLSDAGRTYLAFLHSVELLADARHNGGVDRGLADKYLRSVVRPDVIPLSLLATMQSSLADPGAFGEIRKYLSSTSRATNT